MTAHAAYQIISVVTVNATPVRNRAVARAAIYDVLTNTQRLHADRTDHTTAPGTSGWWRRPSSAARVVRRRVEGVAALEFRQGDALAKAARRYEPSGSIEHWACG